MAYVVETIGLNGLQGNLKEMIAAGQQVKELRCCGLVASPISSAVYKTGNGWGRAWKWFWDIVNFFDDNRFCEKSRLEKNMQRTYKAFHKSLQDVLNAVDRYKEWLDACLSGEQLDSKAYRNTLRTFVQWSDRIAVLFDDDANLSHISAIFRKILPRSTFDFQEFVPCVRDLAASYQHPRRSAAY